MGPMCRVTRPSPPRLNATGQVPSPSPVRSSRNRYGSAGSSACRRYPGAAVAPGERAQREVVMPDEHLRPRPR